MQRREAIVLEDIEHRLVIGVGAVDGIGIIAPEEGFGGKGEAEESAQDGDGEEKVEMAIGGADLPDGDRGATDEPRFGRRGGD